MGDKIDKANENIQLLIEELMDARMAAIGYGHCPYYSEDVRPCDKIQSDCALCKENYRNQAMEELEKEYIIQ